MKNAQGQDTHIVFIPTAFGTFKALCASKGVKSLEFPEMKFSAYKKQTQIASQKKNSSYPYIRKLITQLSEYFSGSKITFSVPVDLEGLTSFEKKVLRELAKVPYGKVVTYRTLAKKTGGAKLARAVGNALGKNPVPVILPCHRVVRSDKSLGGFSGGLHWKKILLSLENVKEFQ